MDPLTRIPDLPRGDVAAPLRIVFGIDSMGIGGTEKNALRLAAGLHGKSFEISVLCLGVPGPLSVAYENLGIRVEYLGLSNLYGMKTAQTIRTVAAEMRQRQPHVLHAHDMYSNVFLTMCAIMARIPQRLTSQRWAWGYPARRYRIMNRWAHRHAARVVTNSEIIAEEVRAATGLSKSVVVLPNFTEVMVEPVKREDARLALRRSVGIPERALVVGCVARLHPVKDHATLVSAFSLLAEDIPGAYLILLGEGPVRGALESQIRALGLGERILLLGEREDVSAFFHGCDVAVLASLREGSPNVLLEAMVAGLSVVATNVGGIPEIVTDSETGMLVPPANPGLLAKAVRKLLEEPDLRAKMGQRAERDVAARYSAARVLGDLAELYRQVSVSRGPDSER